MEKKIEYQQSEPARDTRPYWKVIISLTFSLIGTVLFVWAGVKGLFFFAPFVVGWFIAFIANPLVSWLERKLKIIRKLGSAIIIVLVLGGIVLAGYFAISKLVQEVSTFISNVPELYNEFEVGLDKVGGQLNGFFQMLPKGVQEGWNTMAADFDAKIGEWISDLSQPTVAAAGNIAKKIPSILVATIVMIVSAYFFIAQREEVITWAKKISPQGIQRRMTMIIDNLKYAVGGYFKAQFKIMGVVAVLLWIGFLVLKVEYSILLALLIAFLDFLPFFGTGTALIPWAVYKLFVGGYKEAIGLLIIYGVTQLVRQVIQPKLVGDSVGMNPLLTLVFLYAGYKLGSLIGMILAVPVGMLVINLYKAGAFDYILDDIKTLTERVVSLREK